MTLLIVIVVLILLFGGGGYGYRVSVFSEGDTASLTNHLCLGLGADHITEQPRPRPTPDACC